MTTILVLSAYAALTLAFWIHSLRGMAALRRSPRQERLFGMEERFLISGFALLASAAWVVLLPIHAVGRAYLVYERRAQSSWSRHGHWRRARAIAGRAA